jgi:hypothetical protein
MGKTSRTQDQGRSAACEKPCSTSLEKMFSKRIKDALPASFNHRVSEIKKSLMYDCFALRPEHLALPFSCHPCPFYVILADQSGSLSENPTQTPGTEKYLPINDT